MITTWKIHGTALAEMGMELASGALRAAGTSRLRLRRLADFDAPLAFAPGSSVSLTRTTGGVTTTAFSGKIETITPSASGTDESQTYVLADAWADLEKTIYQEEWATGSGGVMLPRAVLGLGKNAITGLYERLTVGAQIRAILGYAISQGVALSVGAIPEGETMIPEEVANMTCVEALLRCLRLHPDWVPAIAHGTSPPTLSIATAGAVSAAIALDAGAVEKFDVSARTDLIPASVRITYEIADDYAGDILRRVVVDKFPADGPSGGPGCIQAMIPLAGMRMQVQKSRVQTRALPSSQATAKNWLMEKFPVIRDVDPDHFDITAWSRALVAEDPLDFPPDISPRSPRMIPATADDVPRELVRGQIEGWMRCKTGLVAVEFAVAAQAAATATERAALLKLPAGCSVVCTDSLTKTHKNLTHWEAAADVPIGIAAATYTAIVAAAAHSGSVTLVGPDVDFLGYAGKSISILGGETAWETMRSPVHSVDFEVATGTTTIGFGPNPTLAPADFLELQRILRFAPATTWTFAERGSAAFGASAAASAMGDTVGGFQGPETLAHQASPPAEPHPFKIDVRYDEATEELRGYVHPGRATAMVWDASQPVPTFQEILCVFPGSVRLAGDPFRGGADGYETLTAGTTYGVWLNVSITAGTAPDPSGAEFSSTRLFFGAVGGAVINFSDTFTAPADGPAFNAALYPSDRAYAYLGRVIISGAGEVTVDQYRRSDLVIPLVALPAGLDETTC